MQRIIGILFIVLAIWFFYFAKNNSTWKEISDYNLLATLRRYVVSFSLLFFGILMILEKIRFFERF